MYIKWHQLSTFGDQYRLTIEGNVTPRDIYYTIKELAPYKLLLISAYDLEFHAFDTLAKEISGVGIPSTKVTEGLLIEKQWIDAIFTVCKFGESADRYHLLSGDTLDETNLYDITVDYTDIPDLKLTCKSRDLLTQVLHRLRNVSDMDS
ncbi:hypothetical protein LEM8419_01747 [Neolewinella maritima]|uniref:Uncharacterized protein n=2 Tax=Neolewinella maritima TaxID=1383882 RepID=A0ABM9B0Q5_9BACT|nr:hypothetical protein LEM8419_01747 [Neolewinella maritima]